MDKRKKLLILKIAAFCLSITIAVILAKTGFLKSLLTATKKSAIIGSFIAGIFVASGFTATPAIVVLAEIAQANSVFQTALIGGLGALFGDLIIFLFIKNKLSSSIIQACEKDARFAKILKSKIYKPAMIILGALLIATPLPDEFGLALMGISRINTIRFLLLIFMLHTLGIFFAGTIAH